jgi:Icc-related predicted phosphoesterase
MDLGDALRSAAAAPWLVLSGHIHTPIRWKDRCGGTLTLNPGMNPNANAKVPNFISIDSTRLRAFPFVDGVLTDAANC